MALAYDPGFPDLRVLAFRVRDVNADRLLGAYLAVAARAVRDLHVQARDSVASTRCVSNSALRPR